MNEARYCSFKTSWPAQLPTGHIKQCTIYFYATTHASYISTIVIINKHDGHHHAALVWCWMVSSLSCCWIIIMRQMEILEETIMTMFCGGMNRWMNKDQIQIFNRTLFLRDAAKLLTCFYFYIWSTSTLYCCSIHILDFTQMHPSEQRDDLNNVVMIIFLFICFGDNKWWRHNICELIWWRDFFIYFMTYLSPMF